MSNIVAEVEARLMQWKNRSEERADTQDDLHLHFEAFGVHDWICVGDEAMRLHEQMFGEVYEDEPRYAQEGLYKAVAAQASHGACAAIAAMLGLPVEGV